jgi:hypothetical protein
MKQRFRGNALLSLWVCGVILALGTIVPTAMAQGSTARSRAATDTFTLTVTRDNFAQYYPTYLANGYSKHPRRRFPSPCRILSW